MGKCCQERVGNLPRRVFRKELRLLCLKESKTMLLRARVFPSGYPGPGNMCSVCVQTSLCLCCTNTHTYIVNRNWHIIDLSEKSYKSAIPPLPHKQKGKEIKRKSEPVPLGQISFYRALIQRREVEVERKTQSGIEDSQGFSATLLYLALLIHKILSTRDPANKQTRNQERDFLIIPHLERNLPCGFKC